MKNRKTLIIGAALAVCISAVLGTSIYSAKRIHRLEQQLKDTNQRLEAANQRLKKIEAKLHPRIELLGAN